MQPPQPQADGSEAAEQPAEVPVQGIEAPRVPEGPLLRGATAALDIPDPVDELMREHLRFLYKEGMKRDARCLPHPHLFVRSVTGSASQEC